MWYSVRYVPLPSHIYSCIELEELILNRYFILKPPPTDFEGFKHIRKLELDSITIEGDILQSLIAICPKLTILTLKYLGINSINREEAAEIADVIKNLAASCHLKSLHLRDFFISSSTLFVEIEKMKLFPLALTHLCELSLGVLDFDDFGEFSCTFGFIQSCPSIKKLAINVASREDVENQHNYDYDNNYKLGQLVKVDINGVTGCFISGATSAVIYFSIIMVLEDGDEYPPLPSHIFFYLSGFGEVET
ncbi:uncharacterized protein LOC110737956 [Chenopodium quinoa]|uniref:uncharacterized protein LOC110737956 n=1 Tax=Chenopodium quinoa TaxID=63459 RepID=UPI000B77CC4A|nr:uncharacterized protein LOC110737956 [Chenopodium quinoa]